MEWMILPYKRYADFSGRSCRMEYWMFQLFFWGVLIVCALIMGSIGNATGSDTIPGIGAILLTLFFFGSFIPALAVQVRRLHDTGKSGWLILINIIPYIGGLILLVMFCLRGDEGENEYGDNPLNPLGNVQDIFN